MTFRLYIDEDPLAVAFVQALRSRGIDIVTTTEVGLGGYLDDQQLDYATSQERVLYSFNVRDFSALHMRCLERGISHAGIIVAHQKHYSIGEQMRRLLNLMEAVNADGMRDQMIYLSEWG
jgi:hypothetical protein